MNLLVKYPRILRQRSSFMDIICDLVRKCNRNYFGDFYSKLKLNLFSWQLTSLGNISIITEVAYCLELYLQSQRCAETDIWWEFSLHDNKDKFGGKTS